jgi:hypothetical protein
MRPPNARTIFCCLKMPLCVLAFECNFTVFRIDIHIHFMNGKLTEVEMIGFPNGWDFGWVSQEKSVAAQRCPVCVCVDEYYSGKLFSWTLENGFSV